MYAESMQTLDKIVPRALKNPQFNLGTTPSEQSEKQSRNSYGQQRTGADQLICDYIQQRAAMLDEPETRQYVKKVSKEVAQASNSYQTDT